MSVPFMGVTTPYAEQYLAPEPTEEDARRAQEQANRLHRRLAVKALSPRELEIALAFARAPMRTTNELATEQYVSVNTVKTLLKRAYSILGVHKRRELVTWLDELVEEAARRRP